MNLGTSVPVSAQMGAALDLFDPAFQLILFSLCLCLSTLQSRWFLECLVILESLFHCFSGVCLLILLSSLQPYLCNFPRWEFKDQAFLAIMGGLVQPFSPGRCGCVSQQVLVAVSGVLRCLQRLCCCSVSPTWNPGIVLKSLWHFISKLCQNSSLVVLPALVSVVLTTQFCPCFWHLTWAEVCPRPKPS